MADILKFGRLGRIARGGAAACAALVLSAGPALAQGEGGLPQLDPETFGPQLVWLAISFAVLYLLMSKVALPRIAEVLEERQDRIGNDLEKAARMKEEAEQVIAAYESALAEARTKAQAVIGKAAEEIQAAAQARQTQFAADLAAKTRVAEERIAAAREAALANVRAIAAEVVQGVVGKVSGVDLDAATAEKAVAAVVKERV